MCLSCTCTTVTLKLFLFFFSQRATNEVCDHLGGYECEFVKPPNSNIPTECPICKQILRKPYEATCCGQVFCYSCTFQAQKSNVSCPMCKKGNYQIFPNQSVERSLKEELVKCENCKQGCTWVEKLGKYDNHLNMSSKNLAERVDGCKYATISCRFGCGDTRPRYGIIHHEIKECPQQVDDCTETEKLLQLKIHELLLEIVQQEKKIACMSEQEKQIASVHEQKKQIASMPLTPLPLMSSEPLPLMTSERVTDETEQSLCVASDPLESSNIVPVVRVLSNFTKMKNFSERYVSHPFYTHSSGYKMCLWVYPNGFGSAENSHVSLFLCFMKGENDKKLKWPFKGDITVQLLNQLNDSNHREKVVTFGDHNSPYAKRVKTGEMSAQAFGAPELIALESLDKRPYFQYLKDDCLRIRITKVSNVKQRRLLKL